MKSLHRLLVVPIVLLVTLAFSVSAHAGGIVTIKFTGGSCTATSIFLTAHIESTFTSPTAFTETVSVDGVVVGGWKGLQPAGNLSYAGAFGVAFPTHSRPYNYTDILVFPGTTIALRARCNSDGSVTILGDTPGAIFDDGRINQDALETAAIYCMADGSVRVYVPSQPLWVIAFDASPAEIAKVPAKPAKNTLIKSGKGAFLYRLTTGELQVNASSDYVYIFKDCPKPK